MKVHHDRRYIKQGSMTGADIVIYWCGRTMIKGEDVPVDLSVPVIPLKPDDHCKRCLFAKRQDKGDSYMVTHGLPLVMRVRRGLGWTLATDAGSVVEKEASSL